MPQLHVLSGDDQQRTVDLGDRPVSFGRAEDNDVVLSEQKASRRHCVFRPLQGGWRVVDEQSTNGTWLGGKPVLSARLQPGDEIEIGETVITYVAQPSELPKPDVVRLRRPRKAQMPWGALVAALVLAALAWFGSGSLASEHRSREANAWRKLARAEIERASIGRDEAAYRRSLQDVLADLRTHESARDAVTVVEAALASGLPPEGPAARPTWAPTLEQVEAARSRMTAAERRNRLRDLLSRNAGDAAAVEAISAVLRSDAAAAVERAGTEAARLLADAEQAAKDGRHGTAIDDWVAWIAVAPVVSKDDERAVAKRIAETREKARDDAGAVLAQYEEHLKEGRLAAANAAVDAASERLRGTGWDAWLSARTKRFDRGAGGGPTPTAGGTRESDEARARRVAKERLDRAMRSADALAGRRHFTDAAVALTEAASEISDAALQTEVRARAEDLSAAADFLARLLGQIRDDPAHFAVTVPVPGGSGKVAGVSDAGLVVSDAKGGAQHAVAIDDLPGAAFPPLLEKAKVEPEGFVGAAVLLREVKEREAYTAWMRKALAVDALQPVASAVHARTLGQAPPMGGYVPHPTDAKSILTWDERKALQNAAKIADLTAQMRKVIEKVDASRQAKQVEAVAQAYRKLEDARRHALELIFDEVRYFYPYRNRMKEYVPVQRDVDERVKKVEEAWADPASAKVRTDAALEKLLKQADDLAVEIAFLGGDAAGAVGRVERIRTYLGRELTVQTYFETQADLELLDYNRAILDANAKLKGDIDESEREQVRITNEYRRMFGHRRLLRLHPKLVEAARGHSDDMAKLGFFDHMSPVEGKRTPMDRMMLAGYPNTPCSENIHAGSGDPQGAHNGWVHSSGHHRNILMPNWSEMGTGRSGKFWTQNFGFASGDEQAGGSGPQ
jgi:uncharacterized protein YkwD